jgi:hypothetical protein
MNSRAALPGSRGIAIASLRAWVHAAVILACLAACDRAAADVLFWESFNGYTYFPDEIPDNDPVNKGLPLQSEGATEFWYGGRFEQPDSGTIDSDLAVQAFGGGTNTTPVGRVEDDAGILFNISTLNLESATLSFDWRTFLADSSDRLKVGYYVGTLNFGSSRYHDWYADFGQTGAENWWANDWTELLNSAASNSWHSEAFPLPLNEPSVWIAFWLDNGEGDYAKIDNVHVAGTEIVPEPSSMVLVVAGGVACACAALRRRALRKPRRRV